MTIPNFDEKFPVRSLRQGIAVGYNPLTGKWGALVNDKILVAADWEKLGERIRTAQSSPANAAKKIKNQGPQAGSLAAPVEIVVPAWTRLEQTPGGQGAIQMQRAKVYWDDKARGGNGAVVVVKATNSQGNWAGNKEWTAISREDLTPALEQHLVARAAAAAKEKRVGEVKKTAIIGWMSKKTPTIVSFDTHGAKGHIELPAFCGEMSIGGSSSHMMFPAGLRLWNTPAEDFGSQELAGWKQQASGALTQGSLTVSLNENGQFSLDCQGQSLLCSKEFGLVLRLGNVTAEVVREKISPVSAWGVPCRSFERSLDKVHREVAQSAQTPKFCQMLAGAIAFTSNPNRASRERPWALLHREEGDAMRGTGVAADEGMIGQVVLPRLSESLHLEDYVWKQVHERTMYYPVQPEDVILDQLQLLATESEDVESDQEAQTQLAALDQRVLQRVYSRHLDGNPVTTGEATTASETLASWLKDAVNKDDAVISQAHLADAVGTRIAEALVNGHTGVEIVKRARGPR